MSALTEANAMQPESDPAAAPELVVSPGDDGWSNLSLRLPEGAPGGDDLSGPFYRTRRLIENPRVIVVPQPAPGPDEPARPAPTVPTMLALWDERNDDGSLVYCRAIRHADAPARADDSNLDGVSDLGWVCIGETDYGVSLRYSSFDPVGRPGEQGRPGIGEPANLPPGLRAQDVPGACPLHVVQFWTQPLDEFRLAIAGAGGTIHRFLASHSYIVEFPNAEAAGAVATLPYVRWVGAYHPVYRLDERLLAPFFVPPPEPLAPLRYNIQIYERGPLQKHAVAERIQAMGGRIDELYPDGFLFSATLSTAQLGAVLRMNEVVWVDAWAEAVPQMNLAREISGANYLASNPLGGLNFKGQGVRGEVLDPYFYAAHPAFEHFDDMANPDFPHPWLHTNGLRDGDGGSHGTAVFGIVFGNGVGDPMQPPQRIGILPEAEQGIFARVFFVDDYVIADDIVRPASQGGLYRAVFQSWSYGAPNETQYTNATSLVDDILFTRNFLQTRSFGNYGYLPGNQALAEGWAKNVISVGGVQHRNTLTRTDDCWGCLGGQASQGPAADGRVKPDLVHFYDNVYTTWVTCLSDPDCLVPGCGPTEECPPSAMTATYFSTFGGTSATSPIVAGYCGLFFQMWREEVFPGHGNHNLSVHDARCKATTVKAALINTAYQYALPSSVDFTRFNQGWGMPDLRALYDQRFSVFIVDEADSLTQVGKTKTYYLAADGSVPLKATLVYADPPGTTSSTQHRINDLNLLLISPSGIGWGGNRGLTTSIWSVPGGATDSKNTVENVFIQSPQSGTWQVIVELIELNADGDPETSDTGPGSWDIDFALVVSGLPPAAAMDPDWDKDGKIGAPDFALFLSDFLNGRADFDGDCVTTPHDAFAFIDALLSPPNSAKLRAEGIQ